MGGLFLCLLTQNKDYVLFLCQQEKYQKNWLKGALCVALPRAKSTPLRIPRPHLVSAMHLNLDPDRHKNVPIFAPMDSTEQTRNCLSAPLAMRQGFPKGAAIGAEAPFG